MCIRDSVYLICKGFDQLYRPTQGLLLLLACSGSSKSSTAVNIIAHYYESNGDKDVLIISNEENSDTIIGKVACILLRCSWLEFQRGSLLNSTRQKVELLVRTLCERIEVVNSTKDLSC